VDASTPVVLQAALGLAATWISFQIMRRVMNPVPTGTWRAKKRLAKMVGRRPCTLRFTACEIPLVWHLA
jgi:hypothetical protein